jgi:hypothetical protein
MKKVFFSLAIVALLLIGCDKDNSQPPKAEIENLSGVTSVSQGTTVSLRAKVTSDLEYTISWSVNNQTVADATGETFDFINYQPDEYVIRLTVVNQDGADTAEITITVNDDLYVIDFEDPRVLGYLAGPTAYGENLYSTYTGANRYFGYDDPSGLFMFVNVSSWIELIDFSGGGIAISQWNDMTTRSFTNQLSVYYSDATTGFGGYNGSKTFAVAHGTGDTRSIISFNDGETECTFDHFWVTNSAFAVLSMRDGDDFSKKFSVEDQDWFKLVITAYDKDDNRTGATVEFYLADFRTATSPGIITEWTKVDLKPLGNRVHTVKFDLQSSDVGDWGMNTPAYFCFDNLAIRIPQL